MKAKIFKIRSSEPHLKCDEQSLNSFLNSVHAEKIETAFVADEKSWSVIVIYEDQVNSGSVSDQDTPAKRSEKISFDLDVELSDHEQYRYDCLRHWRSDKAASLQMPNYVVASNKEMVAIAKTQIDKPSDLLKIKGFRDRKVEAYGKEIVALLNSI